MYLKKLKIGNVELKNNILLAPMAGITNLPFRRICEKFAPGLVCTEMISSKGLFYNDEKTKILLNREGETGKVAVQIFGSDPKTMGYAAKYVSKYADIIDINMGCPAPKIVKNGDGSKLMLNLELAEQIIKEVVKNSKVPVTVKMRKGWDKEHITVIELAKIAQDMGVSAVTVHGRTRSEFYTGVADWGIIKKVKESVNIPVIGNGDIKTPEDARKMLETTNVDGIMIGRAAIGNPWIFKQTQEYLKELDKKEIEKETAEILNKCNKETTKQTVQEVIPQEKLEIILKHINMQVKELGENSGIKEMRKFMSYYLKGLNQASKIRQEVNKIETKQELEKCLIQYFETL